MVGNETENVSNCLSPAKGKPSPSLDVYTNFPSLYIYTTYNPPSIEIAAPGNVNGTQATASLTVDDTTGLVSSVTITNSGSGYDFVPSVSMFLFWHNSFFLVPL